MAYTLVNAFANIINRPRLFVRRRTRTSGGLHTSRYSSIGAQVEPVIFLLPGERVCKWYIRVRGRLLKTSYGPFPLLCR